MGLDAAEILMELEDAFGIAFAEDEVRTLETPGNIVAAVRKKLATCAGPADQREQAVELLGRALAPLTGRAAETIRAATPLRDLFPDPDCTPWCTPLKETLDSRSSLRLRRPRPLRNGIGIASWGAFGGLLLRSWTVAGADGILLGLLTGSFVAVGLAMALLRLTRAQRRTLPAGIRTVGDLAPLALASPRIRWTDEAVSAEVKAILMRQLGVEASRYSEDSSLVNDFGMD